MTVENEYLGSRSRKEDDILFFHEEFLCSSHCLDFDPANGNKLAPLHGTKHN